MARRVEAVHREHPLVPNGLAQLLESMEEELISHMQNSAAAPIDALGIVRCESLAA